MFAVVDQLKDKPCLVDIYVFLCDDLLDTLNPNR